MTRLASVRPLLQSAPADCGPACLRMVLGHFGRHLSARELTREPVSTRDGVSAAWLIACAERQGLHAEGFEVTVDELAALPTPAILHTTASHFVVFEGLDRGRVVVVDPSVAARWYLDEDEARRLVGGAALAFEPSSEFQRRGRLRCTLDVLSPVLALDRRTSLVATTVAIALMASSLALGSASLWTWVFGGARYPAPMPAVLDRVAIVVGILAVGVSALSALVDASVRSLISRGLSRLDSATPVAGSQQVASDGPGRAASYFAPIDPLTSDVFPDASGIILTVSALAGAVVSSRAAGGSVAAVLAAFCAALASSVVAARVATGGLARSDPRRLIARRAVSCVHLVVCGFVWLTALHLAGTMTSLFGEGSTARAMQVIAPTLLLAVATFRLGGILERGSKWLTMYRHMWDGLPEDPSRQGHVVPAPSAVVARSRPRGGPLLAVRHPVLRLGDARDRLLSELELELNESEHVAIVGPAGAGKSTLARAILGRFRASPGSILYEGRPLHEYRPAEREQLVRGMVQGDWIPDSTIARMLRTANGDFSPTRLAMTSAQLGLDELFSTLPLGYDTPVYQDGDSLSRGQRQMLLLAQVVTSGARVFVLDDPVSCLDDVIARRVLEGISTLPAAVVLTMASASALRDLDIRVIHLNEVLPSALVS